MILEICTYPHPVLKEICKPVEEITPGIRELAGNMLETMYSARGVGLAAPQVGENLRMFVMDAAVGEEEPAPRVVINPRVEFLGETITSEKEGCLSVPMGFRADVPRCNRIRLQALDLEGHPVDEILEGFPAIVVQHESDHLDGKLFIDKIGRLKRALYDGKVKKWQKRKNEP